MLCVLHVLSYLILSNLIGFLRYVLFLWMRKLRLRAGYGVGTHTQVCVVNCWPLIYSF